MMPLLLDRIRLHATAEPSRVAMSFEGATWTYERLLTEVAQASKVLADAGATGRRVAVDLPSCPKHVVALLAVLEVGATAVPLDPKWSSHQAASRLDLCEVSLVLHLDGGAIALQDQGAAARQATEHVPFLLAPTGGTSGTLKAIAISEEATLARFLTQALEFGFRRDSTFLSATPMFHGGGRSFVLSQLYFGGKIILHPGFDLTAYRRDLPQADLAFAVPTMLRRLAEGPSEEVSTTLLISGSAAGGDLPTILAAAGIQHAHDYYASVEAGPISIRSLVQGAQVSSRLAFGVQLPALPAQIDVEGVVLENPLVVGHGVADGILDENGFTPYPSVVGRGREVRMTDRVRVLPGLSLSVEGRTDDVIISGGVNIFPSEIEDALRSIDGIADAVVVGVPDTEWGELVTAALRVDAAVSLDAVRDRLRKELTGPQVPKRFSVMDSLPVTSVGKPDRKKIRSLLDEGGN